MYARHARDQEAIHALRMPLPSRSFIDKRVKLMSGEIVDQIDALEATSRAAEPVLLGDATPSQASRPIVGDAEPSGDPHPSRSGHLGTLALQLASQRGKPTHHEVTPIT